MSKSIKFSIVRAFIFSVFLTSLWVIQSCNNKLSMGEGFNDSGNNASNANNPSNPNNPNNSAKASSNSAFGFGAQAVGGSLDSTVYHVTNTLSTGSGSLINGLGSHKTIVFDVSGTIKTRLDIVGMTYLTIDGSGHDVTIDNNNNGTGISIQGNSSHNIIIKNIRTINGGEDGINVVDGAHDILITNVSSYDNRDGDIDIAGANGTNKQSYNVTVQYSILGRGRPQWSGAMLITGQKTSVHHNLFAPASPTSNIQGESGEGVGERCPLVHSSYSPVGNPVNADVRNNLIWRFGRSNGNGSGYGVDSAYNAKTNALNNYFYTDGDSPDDSIRHDDNPANTTGFVFASGNKNGHTNGGNPNSRSNSPNGEYVIPSAAQIPDQETCAAAEEVLLQAGPESLNTYEQGIINSINLPGC